MGLMGRFIDKIRKAETPGYRRLKRLALFLISPPGPRIPGFVKPAGRFFYHFHYFVISSYRKVVGFFYYHPLFQSRCQQVGRNLKLEGGLPFVDGPVEISIGDDVFLGGSLAILSGRIYERPKLILKDRSLVGWGSTIVVGREVVIEEDVIISPGCRISDTDGHPRDAMERAQRIPPHPSDIKPVRICRYAWVGAGSFVMKGVTIGEGAIVGSNSVVVSDVPAYSIVLGNPTEVFFRNIKKSGTSGD